jgi:UDP-glucose 4-epimerase
MRCLITGASGFLGSHLARKLVKQGWSVWGLVRPQSNLWRLSEILDRINILRSDLTELTPVARAIQAIEPEVVFHLAWQGVTGDARNAPAQVTTNVVGSLALFQLVQSVGCRTWVGVGSQAEYGPYAGVLTEDLPTLPITTYGVAKLCVGLLTRKLCDISDIRYVWMRLLAAYGPQDDEQHLIPMVIRQLLNRQRPALTPAEQKWDYLYVDDAVQALYQVALCDSAHGVFNLGSGEAYPVRDIVERIRDLIDPTLSLGIGEVAYRPDQIMHLQANIGRIQKMVGWRPQTSLDEGLKETIEWSQKRGFETKL